MAGSDPNIGGMVAQLKAEMERIVIKTTADVLAESKRQVPRDVGTLSLSATTELSPSGDEIKATIAYNTPYAEIQHENLNFRHRQGKAKYLEDPIKQYTPEFHQAMADAYVKVFGS